ncbi:MAG: MFS transporter [Lentisphaeria bacterium]|nr:MFS transporter [Lentisphaeria bacterium]
MQTSVKSSGFRAFLTTQFLGALNDNAFKLLVSLAALQALTDSSNRGTMLAVAGVLFTLPFLLFSPLAGTLADRYSKARIMVWMKVAEVFIMAGGVAALWLGSLPLGLGVLFLMGAQSAFFSPAKYGSIPELLPEHELSLGNGHLQLWAFAAMIVGTALGGHLAVLAASAPFLAGSVCVGIALLGVFASLRIPHTAPALANPRHGLSPLGDVADAFRLARQRRTLALSLAGSAWFWFVCALFQVNLLLHAKETMLRTDADAGWLAAAAGAGVGVGSYLAGRLSRGRIEFGLVPLGALGLVATCLTLPFVSASMAATAVVLVALGASCGFFVLPLAACIQRDTPREHTGSMMALRNLAAFSAMLLAYPVFWLLHDVCAVGTSGISVVIGLLSLSALVVSVRILPDFLVRFVALLAARCLFRVRTQGAERVPSSGGALLVCNHVSYLDALIVQIAVRPFVRFVMHRDFYNRRWMRPFARLFHCIPITSDDSPKELLRTLREVGRRVEDGEVVCIFAEGALTRTGNMLPFHRGLEVIMRHTTAPVIPVCLDRVWGTFLSQRRSGMVCRPASVFANPVSILFGDPLPVGTSAQRVREAVQELGADATRLRGDDELLSTRFIRQARRHPLRQCMADGDGRSMRFAPACVAAMSLSRTMGRRCQQDDMVGILLPNSVPTALVNIAVTMLGKVPVNLNFTSGDQVMESAVRKCELRTIVTSRTFLRKIGMNESPEMVFVEDLARDVTLADRALSAAALAALPSRLIRRFFRQSRRRNTASLAAVLFSSGSTGDPKGVMLSHANLNANIEALHQVYDLSRTDRILSALPFFHSFGLAGGLWLPLTTGTRVIFHTNPLDFKRIGELCGEHGVTVLTATPTFLNGYMKRCTPEQFRSLRSVGVGAEKLRESVADAFEQRFGVRPTEGYGCTELSPFATINVPDFQDERVSQTGTKVGTVGHPLPGVAVKVVDPDTFERLSAGCEGLLLVKGANVMMGYLGEPERTADVLRDGWYITGDIAVIDEDGFITLRGRLSRFSKIGGEMVPHLKIEDEISRALDASEERVCVVTGVPDASKGERLVVLHTAEIDSQMICSKLRERALPALWIPRPGSFVQIDQFPLLGSGKLDLRAVETLARKTRAA